MSYRVHPLWWPMLAPLSPALAVLLTRKSRAFSRGVEQATQENEGRIAGAQALGLPVLKSFRISVVVDAKAAEGFRADAGVSYVIDTDRGSLLFDVGHGPGNGVFAHNWQRLGRSVDDLSAAVISHLHLDHMGGFKAQLRKEVSFPASLRPRSELDCYTPAPCSSSIFRVRQIDKPVVLPSGLASTGPLARMLFFLGYTHEQSLLAHVEGRGLVVVIGCAHPSVEVILSMVRRLSDIPIYAIVGGLHFPVTASRAPKAGLQVERIFGTGKRWSDPITDRDLDLTLDALRRANPSRLLVSAHDSCDHALARLERETRGDFEVLTAGQTYALAPC